jgi:hypothetical protein
MDLTDDRQLIDGFRHVSRNEPQAKIVSESKLSESTVKRFRRKGYYPQRIEANVRGKLEVYVGAKLLRGANLGHDVSRATLSGVVREPTAEYPASTADAIIHALGDPEFIRRQAGVVDREDWANFGYQIALRKQLPPDEMKKIMEWREAILRDER